MSKRLPYFKFYVNQWLTGDITLEEYNVQGVFTNVCAFYWSKECDIELDLLYKRFNKNKSEIEILIKSNIIKVKNKKIRINFLDEQNSDKNYQKEVNTENGKKGGRPKKLTSEITENKPNRFSKETEYITERKPNENQDITNIEQNRTEQNRTDKIIEEKYVRQKDFVAIADWQNCHMYEYQELNEDFKKRFSEDIWNKWKSFNKKIDDDCEFIRQIDNQIKIFEYIKLKEEFIDSKRLSLEQFLKTLDNFNNYEPAKEKYNSVYIALRGWLNKEIN